MKYPTQDNVIALYARVSSGEQEKQGTIESQVSALRDRAAAEGWAIVGEYLDNPYTGTKVSRPALDRLRYDAAKGLFRRVLILDPDRLARGKPYLRPIITDDLARLGVQVVYLNYEVQDTPEGRAQDGMISVFKEYERESILARTRRGMLHRVSGGHVWRGRPPYGYSYVAPTTEEKQAARAGGLKAYGRLQIEEDEARWVRQIFAWFGEGRSALWIRDELRSLGIPTKNGKEWHDSTIGLMVRNPIYHGESAWGRTKSAEPRNPKVAHPQRAKSSTVATDPSTWHFAAAPHLITPEQQAAAVNTMAANKRNSRRNTKGEYLLQGLAYCGHPDLDTPGAPCGRKLLAYVRSDGSAAYRCKRRYHDPDDQHKHTYCRAQGPAHVLDAAVWRQIVALLKNPDEVLAQLEQHAQEQATQHKGLEAELASASAALTAAQTRLDQLVIRNIDGALDDITFERLQPQLVRARNDAQERLDAARQAMLGGRAETARVADVRAYCANLASRIEWLEQPGQFAERQRLIRTLVHRVLVLPDHRLAVEGVLPCVSEEKVIGHTLSR